MRGRATRIVFSLPFIIAAGLFVLYLAFGFFLVNPLVKRIMPWLGETQLASRLSVKHVKFNPLSLEATVDGLMLADQNGQHLASLEQLYLNIGVTGLFRWAWRIQDIQLTRPQVRFAVQADGALNWAVLTAKLKEDKKPPSSGLPRLLIDRLKINAGNIEYIDAKRTGRPFKTVIQPLDIEIEGLSTLPGERSRYRIAAKLPEQGGTLSLKGDFGLNPLSSQGEITLEGLRLDDLQRAIKSPLNVEIFSGTLATDLRYRFVMVRNTSAADAPSVQISNANLSIQNFMLAPCDGGAPALKITEARIGNANIDLAKRRIEVTSLSLTGGNLVANRDVSGKRDWQTLFAARKEKAVPASPPPVQSRIETSIPTMQALPWKIAVQEIKLSDWAVLLIDHGLVKPLTVSVNGFGMTAALTGEVGAKPAIEISSVNATLGPVRVLSGAQEAAVLQHAALVNAKLKLAENQLLIDAVELNGLRTSVVLDKNKTLNWAQIMSPASGVSAPAPAKPAVAKSAATDKPGIDVQLARFRLDGIEVGIEDQSMDAPVKLDVAKGFLTMSNLSLNMNKPVPIQAGFSLRQGGNLNAGGTIIPEKASGNLNVRLVGLSFKPFTPYIKQFAKLNLQSGAASTRGKLFFARTAAEMKMNFDGAFAVDGLALTEEETGDPFFGWKRLSSDSLKITLNPNSLLINELLALNPFGKIIIYEDQSINLKRILRRAEPQRTATAPEDGPAEAETSGADAPFPLAIERLRISGANVEFADLSLKPPFGTRMHDLTGVVTGLANDPATAALVELDGKVDEYGSARVRGSVQPFRATDFTDVKLTFRNLEMTNLTSYSGKFAGRKVDSGKLSVDLEYKVKHRQLAGENKVVINKLRLGECVESPEALHLPLDLALAILEDNDGVIDLDLPVSGSFDDPQFSYGKIVWKAVVNVLTKVVTAPFRALGRLIGLSSEKLEAVEFDFAVATLLPPEQEKLQEIGQALEKRRALTLSVSPAYNRPHDTRAIQELRIRREVAKLLELHVDPGQEPGPVDTANRHAQKVLEILFDDRFGKEGGVKAMEVEYEKLKNPVKPVHSHMLERLTLQIKVADAELKQLAQARGEAVKRMLITLGKVDPAKISIGEPVKNDDDDKIVACKITLGTGNKPAPAPAQTSVP